MTPENFIYWLTGFLDSSGDDCSPEQVTLIKDKLTQVKMNVPAKVDTSEPRQHDFTNIKALLSTTKIKPPPAHPAVKKSYLETIEVYGHSAPAVNVKA